MAYYGGIGAGARVFILFLLVIVLVLGGLIWFDYLGILNVKETLSPVFGLLGFNKQTALKAIDDPLLLERERIKKKEDALALKSEQLKKLENDLKKREDELNQKMEKVAEEQKAIAEKEKSFNERVKAFENRRVNLVQNSKYLVGMPPDKAVAILLKMDDQDIIDTFRITEEEAVKAGELSLVSYWLSLMPPERAAELERKMARKPNT